MSLLFPLNRKRIWVAGHTGMVGSALMRRLAKEDCEILTVNRTELDLCNQDATFAWIKKNRPEAIFLAAARVGGIQANREFPAAFLYDNLTIASNIIHAAKVHNVQKLLFLGSSCIYPRLAPQPISESSLLTNSLEPTNQWYAIAKIAGLKMVEAYRIQYGCDFISCMPTNLYGLNDHYDLQNSHVLPALIRKIHDAKQNNLNDVTLWGTGRPRREFLYVDDLADACVHLMQYYSKEEPVNVGMGSDVTIAELADIIATVIGYKGGFRYDTSMPDGTPQKLLNIDRLAALGWKAKTDLQTGIQLTYEEYLERILLKKI
jgi:GDP-L-fucose synthase